MKKLYLIGKVFGKLKVISEAPSCVAPSGKKERRSLCQCVCGNVVTLRNADIVKGHTKSCGCQRAETNRSLRLVHGHAVGGKPTKTWRIWSDLKNRCLNKSNHAFEDYGGRGITVCAQWLDSFESFLNHMGECPPGMSIDRIDNSKGYEPGNCRWATQAEQNRNTRQNRIVTVNGITGCVVDLCERFGIPHGRTRQRLHDGWPVELAFLAPRYCKKPVAKASALPSANL